MFFDESLFENINIISSDNMIIKDTYFPQGFYILMYMSVKIPNTDCSQKYSFRLNYIKWHCCNQSLDSDTFGNIASLPPPSPHPTSGLGIRTYLNCHIEV